MIWDEKSNIPKCIDKNAEYVFNFYGKYSKDEFEKANLNDHKFEEYIKITVMKDVALMKDHKYIYISHALHYKDKKFGYAFFDPLFIYPIATIIFSYNQQHGIKIHRYFNKKNLEIICPWIEKKIIWNSENIDMTIDYIYELIHNQNISLVENNFGIKSYEVKNKYDLRDIIKKHVTYMLNINIE